MLFIPHGSPPIPRNFNFLRTIRCEYTLNIKDIPQVIYHITRDSKCNSFVRLDRPMRQQLAEAAVEETGKGFIVATFL